LYKAIPDGKTVIGFYPDDGSMDEICAVSVFIDPNSLK